ncbi:hypothetical protein ADUPG1_010628 [Aduncisulcus paluster]|uniref:Uncharacterized protein n=1 Tax=Aduncisulcus paluster TaxID=2918883 RepID=A0ABQ5JS79_9EUKA|nr:hypothetical protein ADUPG1_010628 [Aduncisulcus paluster]
MEEKLLRGRRARELRVKRWKKIMNAFDRVCRELEIDCERVDGEIEKSGRECEIIIKDIGKEVDREGKVKKSENEWVKNKIWSECEWQSETFGPEGTVWKSSFENESVNENLLEIGMIDVVRILDPHGTAAMIIEEDIRELERGWYTSDEIVIGNLLVIIADSPQRAKFAGTPVGGHCPCHICTCTGISLHLADRQGEKRQSPTAPRLSLLHNSSIDFSPYQHMEICSIWNFLGCVERIRENFSSRVSQAKTKKNATAIKKALSLLPFALHTVDSVSDSVKERTVSFLINRSIDAMDGKRRYWRGTIGSKDPLIIIRNIAFLQATYLGICAKDYNTLFDRLPYALFPLQSDSRRFDHFQLHLSGKGLGLGREEET